MLLRQHAEDSTQSRDTGCASWNAALLRATLTRTSRRATTMQFRAV